jgi:endonuclease III
MPSTRRKRAPASNKQRVSKVATALESVLGVPRQSDRLPAPLDMLIATVLSQNTNDKNSHRAYTQLRAKYPHWEDVVSARLGSVAAALRVGGMADQKSRRIREILKTVHQQFGGYDLSALRTWTNERVLDQLTRMKGVGPKTASCVLLFSLGRDVFPVDTHVHRLCGRLGLTRESKTPGETFERMRGVVPRGKGYSLHTNLIRFGRKVCRSANPACERCALYALCSFTGKKKRKSVGRSLSVADHDFMLLDNVS